MSRMPRASLMRGEKVTVLRPEVTYDEHMDEVTEWGREEVPNVLVAPSSATDVDATGRPHGTDSTLTLHFPKPWGESLRGCRVEVRGRAYEVVGDPTPYEEANCPTLWWYAATVSRVEG